MVIKEEKGRENAGNIFIMKEFANQVKVINTEKSKIPMKPAGFDKRQYRKDNPRDKALEYSKNIPKPVIKTYEK